MVRTKEQADSAVGAQVLLLSVREIHPNPAQPRRSFDPNALSELAESIAVYGVLQPLSVRRTAAGWELVAGERRLRAARLAGLERVPCIALSADAQTSGLLALVENLQRRDLSFAEEARGIARLMHEFHLTQEQAARRLGKSQSAIANKLRLLRLPPSVLEQLQADHLTERHARALLRLPDENSQLHAASLAAAGGWTVAKTEQYVAARLAAAPCAPKRGLGSFRLRDARLFLNTVHHHLSLACAAGIRASSEQYEDAEQIVLTIRIQKQPAEPAPRQLPAKSAR